MSHIPNSAIPHANADSLEAETDAEAGESLTLTERARELASSAADLARENPKTAIAAGAALFAGAVAAAAIPAVRAARGKSTGSSKTSARSSTGSKKKKS